MRLQDQDAGKSAPGKWTRRHLLLATLATAGVVLSGWARARGGALITGPSYIGGRIVQQVNEAGFPDLRAGNFGAMTQFVAPVAIAVSPMRDIYVADAGLALLFRYDPMQEIMSVVRGARVTQQTRLVALSDGSVVVANGAAAPAARYARSGRLIQQLEPQFGPAYFDDLAVDAISGRFFGLDRVQQRLEEIMPHGVGGAILPEGLLPVQPYAMAMDGANLYVAGRSCSCVVAIEMFARRNVTVVADEIGQISALAAGDGWLALADVQARQLRLYRQGALLAESSFATLGLAMPSAMAIAGQVLYIADQAARRILTFRMRA